MTDFNFTDTIFYQIELTAKYCKLLGSQVFEKFDAGILVEEFAALEVLSSNPDLCQRDLAKLILKDRANTGKLLDTLEKKGFIKRELAIKNNRPVKIVKITQLGIEKAKEARAKIRPNYNLVVEKISNTDISRVGDLLKELRNILKESLEIQI